MQHTTYNMVGMVVGMVRGPRGPIDEALRRLHPTSTHPTHPTLTAAARELASLREPRTKRVRGGSTPIQATKNPRVNENLGIRIAHRNLLSTTRQSSGCNVPQIPRNKIQQPITQKGYIVRHTGTEDGPVTNMLALFELQACKHQRNQDTRILGLPGNFPMLPIVPSHSLHTVVST